MQVPAIIRCALLVALVVAGPNCATTQREGHTTVSLSGAYSAPRDHVVGCAGPGTVQSHRLVGGTAKIRTEPEAGFNAQADLSIARGELTDSEGFESEGFERAVHPSYTLGSFGLLLGGDGRYFGGDLGGTVFFSVDGGDREVMLSPRLHLRFGKLETFWGELMVGSIDGLFDGRLLAGGIAFKHRAVHGNVGFTFSAPVMLNAYRNNILFGTDDDEPYPGGYVNLGVEVVGGFSIVGAGVISKTPSFAVGLGYDIPHGG